MLKTILLMILISSFVFLSCSKDEGNPVEQPTTGSIIGVVTSSTTGFVLEFVNIYTKPPTGYVTTDASGSYTIENVEPGEYSITAAKEGYDSLIADITVSAGAATKANFILGNYDSLNNQSFGLITGTVKNSITNEHLISVSIITVPPTSSVSTNAAGYFSIYNVNPGQYLVTAKKTNYDSTQITITVNAGNTAFADISMMPADTSGSDMGSIHGYAIDASSGLHLESVQVSVNPPVSSVLTDNGGLYTIQNVLPGEYTVKASKSGYIDFEVDVTVTAGSETVADLLMALSTGSVKGTVISSSGGVPIEGVQIRTVPGTSSVATDEFGKYLIGNITPGSISVIANKLGYLPDTLSINISANVTTQADFILKSE
jgi:hypothetical protein